MSSPQSTLETPAGEAAPAAAPARRVAPHAVVVGIGVVVALVTVASGIAATALQGHDDKPIQREVFVNVPSAAPDPTPVNVK